MSNTRKHDCYKCVFRGGVPGSRHSSCSGIFAAVRANEHGTKNGWANHPLDFDPIWIEECIGFTSWEEPDAQEIKRRNDAILKQIGIEPSNHLSLIRLALHRKEIINAIAEAMKAEDEKANNAGNNNNSTDNTNTSNTQPFSPYKPG